jgi:hypothetical protein
MGSALGRVCARHHHARNRFHDVADRRVRQGCRHGLWRSRCRNRADLLWFRGDALEDFFNSTDDDPYSAREIINGDKAIVPSWSGGVPIGNIIADYYMDFTAALNNATKAAEEADYADELLRIVERHE